MSQAKLPRLPRHIGPEDLAADHVAADFRHRYRFSKSLGWMIWDTRRWASPESADVQARTAVSELVKRRVAEHAAASAERALDAEDLIIGALGLDEQGAEKMRALGRDDQDALLKDDMAALEKLDAIRREQDEEREQSGIWLNMLQLARLNAVLTLAGGKPGILTDSSEFDQHPDLLNVRNGVVDLRTGALLELSGSERADLLLTKLAEADFIPGAQSADWTAGLVAVPEDIQGWLQLRAGQSATGHRPDDDVMLVNCGGGENGKTTIISAVMGTLGDYAGLVPHKALMGGDARSHTTELTTFRGLRMAVLEETPEEGRLDVHRVKMTVGSPQITARRMRRDDMTFETTHTMWINTNHMPQVTATDHGTWRRLVAVPWPFKFCADPQEPNERQGDRTLRPRLVDAPTPEVRAAVLAWLVEGAQRWYAAGRAMPEHPDAVRDAIRSWRRDSDVALMFATEKLVADPAAFIAPTDLLEAVNAFLRDEQNRPEWGAPTLKTRMTDALTGLGWAAALKPGRVKPGHVQSVRPSALGNTGGYMTSTPAAGPVEVGDSRRMWWGVRFATARDRLSTTPEAETA